MEFHWTPKWALGDIFSGGDTGSEKFRDSVLFTQSASSRDRSGTQEPASGTCTLHLSTPRLKRPVVIGHYSYWTWGSVLCGGQFCQYCDQYLSLCMWMSRSWPSGSGLRGKKWGTVQETKKEPKHTGWTSISRDSEKGSSWAGTQGLKATSPQPI